MAISSEMMPELVDPSGFDSILASPYQDYHAQQLGAWGLPIRPAMNVDRRRRQQYANDILAQNELANNLRSVLANRQLDVDMRGQDVDLSKSVVSSLDPGNDSAMGALGPVQDILANPEAFDAIAGTGDQITRNETIAKANKAQAEADTEQQRADAATIAAQNAGDGSDGQLEIEYNANGDIIGFKRRTKNPNGIVSGSPSPTTSIYDEGNNGQVELPSSSVTGRKLIRNSDGSGVIVEPDGTKVPVSKENMAKYGF